MKFTNDIAPAYCRVTTTPDKRMILTVVYSDPMNPGMTSGFICTAGSIMSERVMHEDAATVVSALSQQLPRFIRSIPGLENQHKRTVMTPEEYQLALEEAQGDADIMLGAADARIKTLESALLDAKQVLETAGKYFPKSIKNTDRFSLLNVLANSVGPAIEPRAEGDVW